MPAQEPPTCRHYNATTGKHCGAPDPSLYAHGHRCLSHNPSTLADRPQLNTTVYCAAGRCYCGKHPAWTERPTHLDHSAAAKVIDLRHIRNGKRRASEQQYRDAQRNTTQHAHTS